jgi:pyruvate,water dikinase
MHAVALGETGARDPDAVGHKAANLSRFASAFRVPPAFCLTASVHDSLGAAGPAERTALRGIVAEAYARLAPLTGADEPRVAVRSSAIGEDGATASFAGQHETLLNVRGVDAIVDAVFACWRSASSDHAMAYRRAQGLDGTARVAVLVQQMVDSEVSAIAFGVDPVSGDRDLIVIDSASGLGDRIASGDVTPDRYAVRKSDRAIVARPADGVLDLARALEIAELVLALERENGHAVDVECAFAGGALYLLQCRPVTTLATDFPVEWKHPDDANLSWTRDDAHFGEPLPRLLCDYVANAAHFGLRRRAEIDDTPMRGRLEPFNGRFYIAIERRAAGDLASLQTAAGARIRARARRLRRQWDEEFMPRLREHWAALQAFARDAATLPAPDLADAWDALWLRVRDVWTIHMLTTGGAYTVMGELAEKYERLVGGTKSDAFKLTQARAPALQQLERDLHALTERVRRGPAVAGALATGASLDDLRSLDGGAQLVGEIERFLERHGNLGHAGEDMRQLAWADDPPSLLRELDRRIAHPGEDPDARHARLIAEGDAIAARARETLRDRPGDLAEFEEVLATARDAGPLTEEHNYWLDRQVQAHMARVFRAMGRRLAAEGLTADAKDVYPLRQAEISAALRERRDLRELVRERAAEYARWRRLRAPAWLGANPGANPPTLADLQYRAPQDDPTVIKGAPASGGLRRGPATLVRSAADFPKMRPGDVLVCRSSNVSWIPLFTIAAAVVTDIGGPLSHAAVVAREFGVPAVVGCAVALERLRDGMMVEVDGDRGTVRPL